MFSFFSIVSPLPSLDVPECFRLGLFSPLPSEHLPLRFLPPLFRRAFSWTTTFLPPCGLNPVFLIGLSFPLFSLSRLLRFRRTCGHMTVRLLKAHNSFGRIGTVTRYGHEFPPPLSWTCWERRPGSAPRAFSISPLIVRGTSASPGCAVDELLTRVIRALFFPL